MCKDFNPIIHEVVKAAIETGSVSPGCAKILQTSGKMDRTTDHRAKEFAGEYYWYDYNFESEGVLYHGILGFDEKLNLVSISELKPVEKDHYLIKEIAQKLLRVMAKRELKKFYLDENMIEKIISKLLSELLSEGGNMEKFIFTDENFQFIYKNFSREEIKALIVYYEYNMEKKIEIIQGNIQKCLEEFITHHFSGVLILELILILILNPEKILKADRAGYQLKKYYEQTTNK